MQSIRDWLAGLGLEHYAEVFACNDVDLAILPELSEADLEQLGVSLGHRKRMRAALRAAGNGATPLNGAATPFPASVESVTAEGERRQVTVLFCDLVGSTALSNRLDPEIYRDVLARYHERCIACVQRYEGFVAQIQGDGVVTYFGYPLAHEAEAERAIRAALAIVQALDVLDVGLGEPLRVRIGIASGLVVVSHVLAPDKSAVGETPNLAYRLQSLARPGEIMTSERTRALAGGVFDYAEQGQHVLKGIAEPVQVWQVMGTSGAASRFEAATGGRVAPIVGRDPEIALLLNRWELSRSGEGQVILLQGEPGIGKSRMLRAFREQLGDRIETALQYQCSPYYVNSAFYPIIDHLERALRFSREDSIERKLDKLEKRVVSELGRTRTDCHLIARAMALPGEARFGVLDMSPQRQKEETTALLVDIVAQIAGEQASVVLFEDIHWADPSTIEVLNALIDRTEKLPLLVLLSFRPEFEPPWLSRSHVTFVGLTRLSRAQGASIVLRVAGNKPLPADLVEQIVDKTDGVPLFLEELTKTVLESDLLADTGGRYEYADAGDALAIPATLRDSLMARLDRLIPVKEIAQVGACLGREFSYELVRAVSPMDESQLNEALDRFTASELVFRRGTPPDAVYIFKHALVQDAAYDSLLKSKRQSLHAQIASAIRQHFPSKADTEPELLAHHYTEAGMLDEAIGYWHKAGDLAQQRVALQEAIRYYERGLTLVQQLTPSQERDTLELELRALLAMAFVALYGYTHPQVLATLEPALALHEALAAGGDFTLRILWGMWVYLLCSGRAQDSIGWAERLISTATQYKSQNMYHVGHWAACDSHLFLGNLETCIYHANMIIAGYDVERDRPIATLVSHDPKTIALAYKAAAEWLLGYAEKATRTARAAIANARARNYFFDIGWVHSFLSHTVFVFSGDTTAMNASLEIAERVAAEQKVVFFIDVYCPLSRACWLLRLERFAEAEAQFSEMIPRWDKAGMHVYRLMFDVLHAEAMLGSDQFASAWCLLEDAEERIEKPGSGERLAYSEVLRLRARMLLRDGKSQDAETELLHAIETARDLKARFFELRAARDLADLLKNDGRQNEALRILDPIYEWFTEGHKTRDLRVAGALLAELKSVENNVNL